MLLKFTNNSDRTNFNNGQGKASKGSYTVGFKVIGDQKASISKVQSASILK